MSSFMAESEPSINIPSLLTFAVVSFFVFRWFFSSRSASQDDSNAHGGRNRAQTVDPAQLDHLAQMFPQLTRRELMWDLQRNGGSVAATTERILTGRGLETVSWNQSPSPDCVSAMYTTLLTCGLSLFCSLLLRSNLRFQPPQHPQLNPHLRPQSR